jgi:ATP-binding cassette, subfamily B, multidrug efflux pump
MIFGKYINKYYLKYWYFILGVFVFDILVDIIQLYLPRIAGNLVDVLEDASTAKAFMSGQTNDALSALNLPFYCANFTTTLISVAVIALVIVFGRMGWRFFAAQVAGNIERDLRKDMFSHIQTMSLNYYKDKKVGGLLSYFTEDLQTIKQLLSEGFIFMTDLVVLGTLSFTYMFQISWPLTLCCGAPMILFVVFGGLIGKGESKRYKIASDAFESLSDYTEESLQGFSVVKSFLKEGARLKAFKGLCVDTEKKNDRYLNYSSWLDAGINLFITVMYMILLGLALYAMVEVNPFFLGTMVKGGDLVTYVGYFDALIWPMIAGGILISEISMARGAYTRISTILSAKPDIVDKSDSISHDEIQGEIEASHLWFTYPDGNEPALKDVSFKVTPGMTVGIIGRTGSGKSTLVSLFQKLYTVKDKMLYIDGTDIDYWKKADLREHIGYVSQDAFLFSGTLKESIAFSDAAKTPIDMVKVRKAAAFAGVDEDIMSFPDQYDTVVGERGATLSGGQRQRVSIARAIYKDPQVLILDDSLSAVDAETEKVILKNIKDSSHEITTFIIAHRISAIEDSDLILVFDQGRLVGQGKHDDLLVSCPLYHDIVALQELEKEVG